MTYLGLFNEESLRDLIIDRVVNRELEPLTAIKKNNDQWDIFTDIVNSGYYNIEVKSSYYFWKDQYYEYCVSSQEEYNNGLIEEFQLNDDQLSDLINKMSEDKEQFRDYLDLVKDHIDINENFREIGF